MNSNIYILETLILKIYGSISLDYVQILENILICYNNSVTEAIFRKEQKSINLTNQFDAILLPLKTF